MADNENAKGSGGGGGSGKILQILLLVFAVADLGGLGAGLYFVYASTLGFHAPAIFEELEIKNLKIHLAEDAPPLVYTMNKFTVNLGGEPKRTIQIEVNLQMLSEDGFEEVMVPERVAKARDRIVRILGEEEYMNLESIQGKLILKDKIKLAVNSILNKGIVKDLYFSSFVVQ